jgi:hypothetical protein
VVSTQVQQGSRQSFFFFFFFFKKNFFIFSQTLFINKNQGLKQAVIIKNIFI